MLIVIIYDINTTTSSGKKRLSNIAKYCLKFGQRVQNSVIECEVDYETYLMINKTLKSMINNKKDKIRIYNLGNNSKNKVITYGINEQIHLDKNYIF